MKQRSRWMGALAAILLQIPALAQAQTRAKHAEVAEGATIATGPSTPTPSRVASDEPWSRFGLRLDGGVAIIPHHTVGGYARLGGEGMISSDPARARFVWGVWDAYEGWLAKDAGGFAVPLVFYLGYRNVPFVATAGAGLNLFTIDHLEDDTGAGILSPRADVRFGAELGSEVPVVILATSEIQYRWLWGRDDIPMLQFGLSIGIGPGFEQSQPPEKRAARGALHSRKSCPRPRVSSQGNGSRTWLCT
jgi:hypothetical protein